LVPEVVTEPAPAKINPFLRVLGKRDDGYHDIETLILPITLADGVQAVPADDLRLRVVGELAGEVPPREENLVLKAAEALRKKMGESRGAHLLLSKRIPVGAGLGGGSSDAAATLRALDRLWQCGLGVDGLVEVAAQVGSDVPALLRVGPSLVHGRGELVQAIDLPKTWWVLVTQPFEVPSGDAYRWWDEDCATGPDPGPLVEALAAGDLERAGALLFNDLEPAVASRHTQVAEARKRLSQAGALGAVMCGSGPTVAGLAHDGPHAEQLARMVAGTAVASVGSSELRVSTSG
jgi:4-diphosphocytidyl-2-C-methyl-D-erythritol kinase